MAQIDKNSNKESIILETCNLQDSLLTDLAKQQLNDRQKYEQIQFDYKEALLKLAEREDIHRNLLLTFQEQIKIKTNFDKFVYLAEKQQNLQEITNLFETKAKISKDFVKNIGNIQAKFHNLGSEFNEESVLCKINECKSEIEILESTVMEINNQYETTKMYNFKHDDDNYNLENLKQFVTNFERKIKYFENQYKKNQAQIQLIHKNIGFLTEKNAELQAQKDMLT